MRTIILFFLIIFSACGKKSSYIETYKPPSINKQIVKDSFFGSYIVDSYRNIENTKDSIIESWYKQQNKFSDSILANISNRENLINELKSISERRTYQIARVNITDNDKLFYLRKNNGDKDYKLYYRENIKSKPILLYNPENYSRENNYVINYIKPSWNGNYIVISLTHSGNQLSNLIVLDVRTKQVLSKELKNAWPTNFLGVNWLPDNSGFTFLKFTNSDISNPIFKQNSQSVLYLIKNDKIIYIFGNKTNPKIVNNPKLFPVTKINSSNDDYIISYLAENDNFWEAYYTNIEDLKSGVINWKPLYKKSDKVIKTKGYIKGDNFTFLTAYNSENNKIMSAELGELNIEKAKLFVAEKNDEVIDDFEMTSNAIYFSTLKYGVEANLYKFQNNMESKITLPQKAGKINLSNKSIYENDLWVTIKGWTSSNSNYKFDNITNVFTVDSLYPKSQYPEFSNIVSDEVLVKSHDGTEVPLSIIYNKNIKKDSSNPVFIYGYGAYGDIESPYFSPIMMNFINKGGVFCVAHVRGGGEKGEVWHKDGYKTKKSNTWKDFIACTEYLIDNNYTSKDHTIGYGASAGATMVTRAMIERPDLFKVIIAQVGYLNPFRAEEVGASGTSSYEFGKITDSLECLSLIKTDPYLNIQDNINYPSVFLTAGMNDAIVPPWMVGKFTAKLQNSSENINPIIFSAEFDEGHDGSSDPMKIYKEWGDIFSFSLWQTGHPDYQLISTE
ncbi:MAG: prolyl oligopeptidase family serine peptidase [Mesoflavibacter sp.]|nr:prolyl oligopeptidase family serine peptidase [Mesoflavibacter sp.]